MFIYRLKVIQQYKFKIDKNFIFQLFKMDGKQKYSTRSSIIKNEKLPSAKNNENVDKVSKVDFSGFKIQNKPKMNRNKTSTETTKKIELSTSENSNTQTRNRGNQLKKNKVDSIVKLESNESQNETGNTLDPSVTLKKEIKREHIKVEYDPIPPKRKIKEGHIKTEIKNEVKMPLNWEIVLHNLREMRKDFNAPVDSMGCHKCHDEKAPLKVNINQHKYVCNGKFYVYDSTHLSTKF